MKPHHASFVVSATKPSNFPVPSAPEIAFAGRSNVGKSSLINAMVGHTGLARTSGTPGRTQLINWFDVRVDGDRAIHFVDLPGFGYAKVSRTVRASWGKMVEGYLQDRDVLRLVIVLIDIRRGPQQDEAELVDWLSHHDIPVQAVLTKGDKLPKSKRKPEAFAAKKALELRRTPIVTAAKTREGIDELWRAIARAVELTS